MKQRFKILFFLVLLHIFIFSFFRIFNYIKYFDIFSSLGTNQMIIAFIDGIRFDLSIFFTFSGILFLLVLVPVNSKLFHKINASTILILLNFYIIILSADIEFFGNVKRHLADEILLMKNDLGFITSFIKGNIKLNILIFMIFVLNIFILKKSFFWINSNLKRISLTKKNKIKASFALFLFLTTSVLIIRGTPSGRPINVIDAFTMGSKQYGNLVLNGVFTAYHSSRAYKKADKNFFNDDETAFKKASSYIIDDHEIIPNEKFPLEKKIRPKNKRDKNNYNIAIILLESWSYAFIDSLSGSAYGVTPNIDEIAKDAFVFKNFYANGQRSIVGIASTLLSIPQINGLPYLGQGLEVSNVFRVANYFNNQGYRTIAVQSSGRRSFRVSSITKALGFKEFYGREDIPVVFNYTSNERPNFGWDYDTLEFFYNKLDSGKKPFFSFVFTGTTHEKFILPHEKFEKYPHDQHGLNGFLNTLYYSDYSIGKFFEKAKKADWFKNTIFIITADHCLGKFQKNDINAKFKIPLMVYAPGIIKKGESQTLGSQVDIIPTILDLTGADISFSGTGKSLLRKSQNRFAILNQGKLMTILNDKGSISMMDKKLVSSDLAKNETQESLKDILFSVDQSVYKLVKNNRFYKF